MSYAIVFSSKTGNTSLLADTLRASLPQNECTYFGAPAPEALEAETLYIGFWTDKGHADDTLTAFLQTLKGKRVFLFGTAGFGGSAPYFEKILAATRQALDGSNREAVSLEAMTRYQAAVEAALRVKDAAGAAAGSLSVTGVVVSPAAASWSVTDSITVSGSAASSAQTAGIVGSSRLRLRISARTPEST